MSKTAKRKLTASDREKYPFNTSMIARVQMHVMAVHSAFRALDMIHENADKAFACMPQRLREIYNELYEQAKKYERLTELAGEGRDDEAMEQFGE